MEDAFRNHLVLNISKEQLELAVYMANSSYMHCIIAFRIVTSLLGIIVLFSMLCMRWQITHGSLVILVTQHTIWALLMSLSTLGEACTTAYEFLTWIKPEDLFKYKDSISCFHRSAWLILALHGSIMSMVVVTIERGVAYLRRRSYERTSLQLGIFLATISLAFTALLQYGLYIHYDFDEPRFRCRVITPSGEAYHQTMALILLSLELLTIAAFLLLLRLNRAKLAGGIKTLTERYQLSENIRTLEYLVPIISSTTAFNVGAIVLFVVFNMLGLDKKTYALCEDSISFLHLHTIVLPIVLFMNNRKEERSRDKVMCLNRTHGEVFVKCHTREIQKAW